MGVVAAALLILAVEGVLLYRYYDRYYSSNVAPGTAASSSAPVSEETTAAIDGASNKATDKEVSFIHRATDENSRDFTYLDHPSINGDPDAIILVKPGPVRGSPGDGDYGHNIGVFYESTAQRWAIFNQDRAPVAEGATFRVVLPPASESFLHYAELENTVGNITYLDDPLTNGKPDASVSVTQSWNPGGGAGVDNDHSIGIFYDEDAQKWAIKNRGGTPMPEGAAFNCAVLESDESAR